MRHWVPLWPDLDARLDELLPQYETTVLMTTYGEFGTSPTTRGLGILLDLSTPQQYRLETPERFSLHQKKPTPTCCLAARAHSGEFSYPRLSRPAANRRSGGVLHQRCCPPRQPLRHHGIRSDGARCAHHRRAAGFRMAASCSCRSWEPRATGTANVRLASGRYPCSRAAKATEETKRKKTTLPKSNVTHLPQKYPNRHNHQHPPHLALLPPQPIQTPTHSSIKPRFTSTRTPARPRKRPRHIPRRRKPTAPQRVLNRPDPLPILPVKHPLPHLVQPAIRSPDMLARQSRYNSLVD